MKVLLLAIGTRGDVQPFAVLGRELASRGHDVTIAAPPGYSEMIESAGAAYQPLPIDFQSLIEDPEIKRALTSMRGKLRAFRLTAEIMNEQLSAIWRIGLESAPDVILNHFKAPLAPYLARRLGAVSIPVMLQPGLAPTRAYPQFFFSALRLGGFCNLMSHRIILALMRFGTGVMLRRWLKHSGMDIGPPMDPMGAYSADGKAPRLHAYSGVLCPRPDDWPETDRQTGYFFAEPAPYEPSAALSAFLADGPKPIYVGFGSMPSLDRTQVSQALRDALARTGQRAILATGWGGIDELQTTDAVHVLDAVPHTWLFPRVAAVVHHGGSGTTHEGLRWGCPSVICPIFADQPFFGRLVADLGAGPKPIPHKKLAGDRLAAAIESALGDTVRARAIEIGGAMRQERGVANAVDLIERTP